MKTLKALLLYFFFNMALLKRKKQQLNQGIEGTLGLTRNEVQNAVVAV